MNYIFKTEIIEYEYCYNNHKDTIVFLHGWGGDKNSFNKSIQIIKNKYNHLTITFPTIQDTNLVWDMHDYRDLILKILRENNIKEIIIICHSFGFRVASLMNGLVNIKKIIVTGGAGMKKKNIYKRIECENNLILLKNMKNQYLYDKISSEDYKNLSSTNKQTFKNIVNFNTKNLIKFNCPMLLFWGKKDTETPLWIAKKLHKKNRSILIVTNSDHFAYLKESQAFNHEINKFLLEQYV